MSVNQALRVLGLSPHAERKDVRTTYRRLAFQHHPDRNGGRKDSMQRFQQLTSAYKVLERKFHIDSKPKIENSTPGECDRCGQYSTRLKGLDGNQYCSECVTSGRGRPALPAPPVVIVSCGFAVVSLLVAVLSLMVGLATGQPAYTLAAIIAAVTMNISLGITCVAVAQTAERRELRKRR